MQKPSRKCLKLEEIRLDYRLQSRVNIDQAIVSDYREAIKAGEKMPAVSVVFDKVYYYLVDGFHRYEATKTAGQGEINADVVEGHFRDAVLASVGANSKHGLRRTNDDKRRAVMMLLDDTEWAAWSDLQIAKTCGVSHPFVAGLRKPEVAERQQTARDKSAAKRIEKLVPDVESDSTPPFDNEPLTPPPVRLKSVPAEANQDAPDDFDANAELVVALEENQALSAQIDALSVDDTGAELLKEVRIRQGIEARLSQEMEANKRQDKDLRWFGKQFEELRKILGVDSNSRIVAAVKALLRKEAA